MSFPNHNQSHTQPYTQFIPYGSNSQTNLPPQSSNESVTQVPIAFAPDPPPGMEFRCLPRLFIPFMDTVPMQPPSIPSAPQYRPNINMQSQRISLPQIAPQPMQTPYQQQQQQPIKKIQFAFDYLKKIQRRFPNQPDLYEHFRQIFVWYQNGETCMLHAIHGINCLVQGDPTLLVEFNQFLPPGYHIECTTDRASVNVITPSPPPNPICPEMINQLRITHRGQYFYLIPRPVTLPPNIVAPYQVIPNNLPITTHPITPAQQQVKPSNSQNTLPPNTQPNRQPVPNNSHNISPNTSPQQPMKSIDRIKARFSDKPEICQQLETVLETLDSKKPLTNEMSDQFKNALKDDLEFAQEFRLFISDMLQSTGSSTTSQSVDKPNDENPLEEELNMDVPGMEEGHLKDQTETDIEEDMDYGPDYIDDEPHIDLDMLDKNDSVIEEGHSKDQAETDVEEEGHSTDQAGTGAEEECPSKDQAETDVEEDTDYGSDDTDDEPHSDLDMLDSDEDCIFVEPIVVIEKLSTESEDEEEEEENAILDYIFAVDSPLSDLENSIVDSEQPSDLEQKEVSDTDEEKELTGSEIEGSGNEQEDKDMVVEDEKQKTDTVTSMTIALEDEPHTLQGYFEKENSSKKKDKHVTFSASVQPDSPKAMNNTASSRKRSSKETELPLKKRKAIDLPCGTSIDETPRSEHHKQCTNMTQRKSPLKKPAYKEPTGPVITKKGISIFPRISFCINNPDSYREFLKLLNMYINQILDVNTLVELAEKFIGKDERLFKDFKKIVGYVPEIMDRPKLCPKPDLELCEAVEDSPSYRIVPFEWREQQCSARDALAREVLNDIYVSCRRSNSEDSAVSTKSDYEERLFKYEDKRYYFSHYIDASLRTVEILRAVISRMEGMEDDEQQNHKWVPNNNELNSIPKKIIQHVYGKEDGEILVELMSEEPAKYVPIVINRLTVKCEDWQKELKAYNRMTKKQEAEDWYMAMHRQAEDIDRFLSTEELVFESMNLISSKQTVEGFDMAVDLDSNCYEPQASHPSEEPYQFKFWFNKPDIFHDVSRVILSYLDQKSFYSADNRDKIRQFLQNFIPQCFQIELEHIETEEQLDDEDDNMSTDTDNTTHSLRNQEVSDMSDSNEKSKLDFVSVLTKDLSKGKSNLRTFFCSTSFYCFLRQYETIYQRLARLSQVDAKVRKDPHLAKEPNSTALELELLDNPHDSVDLSNGYYNALLKLIDRFFSRKIDHSRFEYLASYILNKHAHHIFNIDRLVHALIKQVLIIMDDPNSTKLVQLFHESIGSNLELGTYRHQADIALEPTEHFYQIDFNNKSKFMTIELVRAASEETNTDESQQHKASKKRSQSPNTKEVKKLKM